MVMRMKNKVSLKLVEKAARGNREAAPEPPVSIEEKTDLYDAIDQLPPVYKTVVILQYFEGMKIMEIAQVMNIPAGSVKAYLFRAKEALRNQLRDGKETGSIE